MYVTATPGDLKIVDAVALGIRRSQSVRRVIFDTTPAFNLTAVNLVAPAARAAGALRWNFTGTLQPGATGTVTFTVIVDQ